MVECHAYTTGARLPGCRRGRERRRYMWAGSTERTPARSSEKSAEILLFAPNRRCVQSEHARRCVVKPLARISELRELQLRVRALTGKPDSDKALWVWARHPRAADACARQLDPVLRGLRASRDLRRDTWLAALAKSHVGIAAPHAPLPALPHTAGRSDAPRPTASLLPLLSSSQIEPRRCSSTAVNTMPRLFWCTILHAP